MDAATPRAASASSSAFPCASVVESWGEPPPIAAYPSRLPGARPATADGAALLAAAQAAVDPAWIKHLRAAITKYNTDDAVSNAAKVQKFSILPHDFVFAGEDPELTATLKLKRPVVVRKYAAAIEAMYAGTGGINVKG